jgi:hypothetical protein
VTAHRICLNFPDEQVISVESVDLGRAAEKNMVAAANRQRLLGVTEEEPIPPTQSRLEVGFDNAEMGSR